MINDKQNLTIFSVVLKQDVNTVDVVRSIKIHHPPHCLVWTVKSYCICPHACCNVSVHGVS